MILERNVWGRLETRRGFHQCNYLWTSVVFTRHFRSYRNLGQSRTDAIIVEAESLSSSSKRGSLGGEQICCQEHLAPSTIMGVPKFFRWMSERYPAISQLIAENRIPEFDCLYLDMSETVDEAIHAL